MAESAPCEYVDKCLGTINVHGQACLYNPYMLISEVTCHGVLHTLAVTETVTGLACFTLDTPAQTVANCGSCRAQLTQHFSKKKKAETKGVRNAATPIAWRRFERSSHVDQAHARAKAGTGENQSIKC